MELEQALLTQIVAAAVAAAGPVGTSKYEWDQTVREIATDIAVKANPSARLGRQITGILNAKVFPGTVLGITKEQSSTRGLVQLKTRPSKHHPDGIETARTDRTDGADGLAMAKRLRALTGHRVLVWIEMETFEGGPDKGVRVIRHIEDLGTDKELATETAGDENAA